MSKLQLIFILIFSQKVLSQAPNMDINILNIIKGTKQLIDGAVENIPNSVPNLKEIIEAPKNVAVLPLNLIIKAVDSLCTDGLIRDKVEPPELASINKIGLQLHTPCKISYYKMNEMVLLANDKNFDRKKKTVVLVTGWTQNVNNTAMIRELTKAYFCRGEHNVIVVDPAIYTKTVYSWSAYHTARVGEYLGTALTNLYYTFPEETRLHIIGFSLGAHIASRAAKYTGIYTKKLIERVTGLDPAGVCFYEGGILGGLFRGDAEFVDVIHTNPLGVGTREPLGDVDFYPHGETPVQPGCLTITCSHNRSWRYYTETVYPGNENNFMSTECSSFKYLRDNKCLGNPTPMGYNVSIGLKGKYFLDVNSKSPFGLDGSEEREEKNMNCGLCPNES